MARSFAKQLSYFLYISKIFTLLTRPSTTIMDWNITILLQICQDSQVLAKFWYKYHGVNKQINTIK